MSSCLESHVNGCGLSLELHWEKGVLSQLKATSASLADLQKKWRHTAASCSTKRLRQGDNRADLQKKWRHTAASCSTKRLRQGENRKKASSSLYLDELLIQKRKFRHRFTVNFLPGKAFPEGFLPTWRKQQEWHTCSEMSFRITDVDCIGRAKTPQLNLPGVVWWPNVYIYIYIYTYIYCDIPAAHDGAQGLSLQCPATAPTEGVAVQGHCMQVRLHGSRGGVFVGHRPPRDPSGPLQIIEVLHLFRWYTHTHTQKKSRKQWFPSKKIQQMVPAKSLSMIFLWGNVVCAGSSTSPLRARSKHRS